MEEVFPVLYNFLICIKPKFEVLRNCIYFPHPLLRIRNGILVATVYRFEHYRLLEEEFPFVEQCLRAGNRELGGASEEAELR